MLAKFITFSLLIWASQLACALDPINGSYQKHYNNENKQSHWLILGAIERIKGAVKPESELRVSAKVRSWLWQIPVGLDSEGAFSQMKAQVEANTTTLFECRGRSCGLSNDFANQVFQQSILFGRDSNQHYWIGLEKSASGAQANTLWLVYSIQRSNKRVYVYMERIKVTAPMAGLFDEHVQEGEIHTLFAQGYFSLAKLQSAAAQLNERQIQWLKELLQKNPNKKFALVVHRYAQQDHQGLIESSELEAQTLIDQLASEGAFIKNLYIHGAGAMMPRMGEGDRIELVVLQ